jgi:hypothetical protein
MKPAVAAARASRAALALIDLAKAQDTPFGHEFSSKLCAGKISADRHLLSLPRDAFGDSPELLLFLLSSQLGLDTAWHDRMRQDWESSTHIHLGVEAHGTTNVWKVYFETPQSYADALGKQQTAWCRVHRGYKWQAGASKSMVVSRYDALVNPSLPARRDLIAEALGSAPGLQETFTQMLEGLPGDPGQPMLLRVSDENSSRISIDVNLYPFGLTVGQCRSLLLSMAACCDISPAMMEAWLEKFDREELGHLAAGCSAEGLPFVTLYCGMDEWTG